MHLEFLSLQSSQVSSIISCQNSDVSCSSVLCHYLRKKSAFVHMSLSQVFFFFSPLSVTVLYLEKSLIVYS